MMMKASSISLLLVALLHSTVTVPSQGSCPDGSYPVNCLINPCQYATCPAVEGATCVADYCRGCNARWLLNGQEITSQCEGGCLDGSYPVNCLINPCQYATCPAVEGATCVADYCEGCNARWLLNGQEVTGQCEGCPDGSQPVICLVDPCEYASCPAITSATCVADYCGGCNARWYVKDLEVTHVCDYPIGRK